ncbi:hypothetical protein WN943_007107 [Citrus x changshan-huyou]
MTETSPSKCKAFFFPKNLMARESRVGKEQHWVLDRDSVGSGRRQRFLNPEVSKDRGSDSIGDGSNLKLGLGHSMGDGSGIIVVLKKIVIRVPSARHLL